MIETAVLCLPNYRMLRLLLRLRLIAMTGGMGVSLDWAGLLINPDYDGLLNSGKSQQLANNLGDLQSIVLAGPARSLRTLETSEIVRLLLRLRLIAMTGDNPMAPISRPVRG